MAAELAIIAKLQDEASGGIRALRGEIEGIEPSTGIAAKGFANLQTIGAAALAGLATAALAVGGAIASSIGVAAEFQDSVTILAIAAKGAGESFDSMRAAAMAVGADTSLVGVNASGAAEAMTTLYKAGMTTGEIFGDLNGYLAGNVELSGALRAAVDGAAASELSMDQAAMLAATSLATFGSEMVTTEQRAQFVNTAMNNFVQTADASMASVADLAAAMANLGPTAAQFGFSLQDTNTALALLSTRGILGSEAGTALKSMFVNLMRPTADVKGALSELNVSLYNADGTMRSMPAIIGDLSNALYGAEAGVAAMTEEQRNQYIATLAGSYGMKAMAVLLMEGTTGWEAMEKAIASAATIQEVAAARTQTFSGAMEALSGVVETIRIGIGSAFLPVLTSLARALAELASENMDRIVGSFEAVGAAIASFFDAIMGGTPPIQAFVDAVGQLATALGMPAEKVEALKTTLDGLLTLIGGIVGPIAQAITSFVSWKDVLAAVAIAVGSVLIPAVAGIVGAIAPVIAIFAAVVLAVAALRHAWESDFLGIRSAVEGAVEIFGRFVEAIRVLTDENARIQAVADALGRLPEPLQLLAAAVASFINTLRDGGSLVDAFRAGLETLKQAIFDWAGTTNWSEIGSMILDKIAEAFSNLGDRAATAAANILNWISTAVNSIDWNAVGTAIVNGIAAAIAAVVGLLAAAGTAISGFFNGFFTNESLATAGTNIVTAIGNAISGAAAGIASGLESIKQAIFDWAGADSWSEVGQTILDRIADAFRNLGDRVAELEAGLFNWIASAVDGIDWRTVGESIINGIVAAISAVVGLLVTAGTAIVNYFIGFFTNEEVGPAAENLISSLSNAIGELAAGIGDGLAKVRDFIFDWAGAEDWTGVAAVIVEMVGEGLAVAADFIADQLSTWQEAIFDWADAEDWGGVAETIAERVGESLADAAEAIGEQLDSWRDAIFDWADAEDWGEVAAFIAESVGEALADAADAIGERLEPWREAIFDWAGAEDWTGVAETIIEMVGEALADAADAIGERLEAWREAIFDWAGAEDWTGVATTIAERIGEALGGAADSVISTLSSWEDAIFDWADGEDWGDVSETIATAVGDSLADASDRVTEKLSGWIKAFTDWVNSVDWYQVGYDIMFKITDAFLDFKEAITEKVATWLADTKTATEGYAWYEVGAYILLKVAEAAAGFVADWTQTVLAWIKSIGAAVTNNLANLQQVGRDLVAGIAAGISAAVDLIQGAVAGVIGAAEPAARSAAQSQSPARIMMPVGYDLTAGVAVGIIQGTGLLVDAIQEIAGSVETEGAKAFGEAMKAIAEGVAAALSAILDIGSFGGAGEGFGAAMQALVDMMAAMVAAVAKANTYTAEVLENLGTFVEAAGAINDLLTQTADVVDYIGRWRTPDIAAANGSIETLAGFLGQMVQGIISLNLEAALLLGALGDFLDAAAELPALFMGVADIASYLAGWSAPSLGPVIGNVNLLAGLLGDLVTAVAGANTMGLGMLDILATFIETATGIVALIAPLADAMLDIANFPPGAEFSVMQRNIETMAGYLAQIVTAVAGANTMGALSLENLGAFVEVAGEIVGLIAPMAQAMLDIASFPPGTEFGVMQNNIETMAGYLHELVAAVAESNTWGQLTLELLGAFVEVAGQIAELIVPMTEAIWNIANFQPPNLFAFLGNLATLAGYLNAMVVWFYSGLNLSQAALEALGQYVEVMSDIADGMTTFIDAIAAIAAFEPPDLFTFIGNVATLAGYLAGMVAWFYNGLNLSQAALDVLGQYIEVMTDIADGMVSFIDAIAAIAAFQPPDLFAFLGNLATLAGHLGAMVTWFWASLNLSQAALEALGQYVEVIGDLVDLIADAIEALGLIAGYSSDTATLGPAIAAFSADLMLLVQALAAAFASASVEARAAILDAGDFADAAGDILGVVEDGVDALTALAGYVSVSGVGAAAQQFAIDLAAVIAAVVGGLQQAGILANAAVVAAGDLADGVSDILGVVEDGVDAIAALAAYVPTTGVQAKAQQFAIDLAAVITAVVSALQQARLLANQAVVEAGELADGLADILGVVGDGVEAITALAAYVPGAGIQAKAQQFATDLAAVITAIVNGLAQAGLLANQAVEQAGELAGNLGELLGVVATGIEAINAIAEYTSEKGLAEKVARFAADLITVATTLTASLTAASQAISQEAMSAAVQFATDAAAILSAVDQALTALAAIGEHKLAEGLAAKIQVFGQQLIDMTMFLALGLGAAAAQLGEGVIADAVAFATAAASILSSVDTALKAMVGIGENKLVEGLSAKIQAFAQQLIDTTTFLALGLGAAAVRLGEGVVADALSFSTNSAAISQAVDAALKAMVAIGENKLADGLSAKIQAFAQQLIDTTTFLALGLGSAAARLGAGVVTEALSFAADSTTISQAVDVALKALATLAANQLAAGMGAKIQALGQQLVDAATYLALSLADASRALGPEIVAAAAAFASATADLAHEVTAAVAAFAQLAAVERPNIEGVVSYIVAAAELIRQGFSAAGDIGQAVAYAAAFRANLTQLVAEVQGAVTQLNALAGTGTTGTIGAALANIAASLMNTQGQFTGSGTALANALIAAMTTGINGGQAIVVVATQSVIGTAAAAGVNAAGAFTEVGREVIDSIIDGVQSGQAQVVNAVVAVVAAAINAGLAEARRAAEVGREVIQAALAEVNSGRGALDTAGAAAGNAIIDGMVRAIANGKSRLVNAIKEAVAAAVAAAKAALGIASPSKVADGLMSNFMGTAANTIDAMGRDVAAAMTRAMRMAAVSAEAGLGATYAGRASAVVPTTDGLAARTAAMPVGRSPLQLAAAGGGTRNQVVIYGDLVLPGVSDSRSFLEELDALRGGV